jgi:UDP-2,3-diacylglucosamine pyrophosphatase LpxH
MKIKIISDIHLGLNESNDFMIDKSKFLIFLIKLSNENDYLILLGDVFECWESEFDSQSKRFCDLKIEYKDIIDFIENTENVILISGNHDVIVYRDKLIQKVKRFFVVECGLYSLYFSHGHQSDIYNSDYMFIGRLITRLVGLAENYIDPDIDHSLSKLLDTFNPHDDYITLEHALCVAKDNNYDLVVYGHTHSPMVKLCEINYKPVIYANSGSVAHHEDLIDVIEIDCDVELIVNYFKYSIINNKKESIIETETLIK